MADRLLQRAMEMRNAIDHLESAMMGLGDFVELPRVFEGSTPTLQIAPRMTVEQMRNVCGALSECTRIINSDDFTPTTLRSLTSGKGEP